MKVLFTSISVFASLILFAQVNSKVVEISDSGKNEFKQQAKRDTPNYALAFRILNNQIRQNPTSAELRYFLGYTIDRINSVNGDSMYQLKKELTIKASEQFEEVNRLQPIYKGEVISLDPYSKIGSCWGALAEAYLTKKLCDSAEWAFREGKRRGGFIDPLLEYNRQLLNSCEKNGILVTVGDNVTITCWYLQTIEHFRLDVTVVDAGLLNAPWYFKYLKYIKKLAISLSDLKIDTTSYIEWEPTVVRISDFTDSTKNVSWELYPTLMKKYLLRGDIVLINVLQQNYFYRPIYFVPGTDSSQNMFLDNHLFNEGLVDRLDFDSLTEMKHLGIALKNLDLYNIDKLNALDIIKSEQTINTLNEFRYVYARTISKCEDLGDIRMEKYLLNEMKRKFPKEKLPYFTAKQEKQYEDFYNGIEGNLN